jgi:hypothetical protein
MLEILQQLHAIIPVSSIRILQGKRRNAALTPMRSAVSTCGCGSALRAPAWPRRDSERSSDPHGSLVSRIAAQSLMLAPESEKKLKISTSLNSRPFDSSTVNTKQSRNSMGRSALARPFRTMTAWLAPNAIGAFFSVPIAAFTKRLRLCNSRSGNSCGRMPSNAPLSACNLSIASGKMRFISAITALAEPRMPSCEPANLRNNVQRQWQHTALSG